MKKIFYALLPMFFCNSVNKDEQQKKDEAWKNICKEEYTEDIKRFVNIQEDNAKDLEDGLHDKNNSLQDKAKVTAVAVTLAFTMVGGLSTYLLNLKEKFYTNGWITGFLVLFVIASCFYLIVAGYYSLLTLNSRPKYHIGPKDFEYLASLSTDKKKEEKLLMIGSNYQLTSYQNTILNNYVDCSNNNLRNALISLGLFFSLICISFTFSPSHSNMVQEVRISEKTKEINRLQKQVKELNNEITKTQRDLNQLDDSRKMDNIDLNLKIHSVQSSLDKLTDTKK